MKRMRPCLLAIVLSCAVALSPSYAAAQPDLTDPCNDAYWEQWDAGYWAGRMVFLGQVGADWPIPSPLADCYDERLTGAVEGIAFAVDTLFGREMTVEDLHPFLAYFGRSPLAARPAPTAVPTLRPTVQPTRPPPPPPPTLVPLPAALPPALAAATNDDLSVRLTRFDRWDSNWVTAHGEVCNRATAWTAVNIGVSFYYYDNSGLRWSSSKRAEISSLRPGSCETFSASLFEVFPIARVTVNEATWRWRAV